MQRRFASAAAWSVAGEAGSQALSLVFVMVLARLLEPADFGIVAAVTLFLTLAVQFSIWGIDRELLQRPQAGDMEFSTGFWMSMGLAIAVTVVLMVVSPAVGQIIEIPTIAPVLCSLSLVVVFRTMTQILASRLIRDMEMVRYAVFTLVAKGLAGLLAVFLALAGLGVWALVAQQLALAILGFVLVLFIGGWVPRLVFRRALARELLSFGLPMTASDLLTTFNRESPRLIVGALLGAAALGYFSMASRIAELMSSLAALAYSRVAIPAFARLRSNLTRFSSAYLISVRLIASLLLPVFILVAIFPDTVISILFGSDWRNSNPVLSILTFAGILTGLNYMNGAVVISFGRPAVRFWMALLRATVGTAALLILTPFGITFAAAALVIRGLIVEPLQLGYVLNTLNLRPIEYIATLRVCTTGVVLLALVCVPLRYLVSADHLVIVSLIAGPSALLLYGLWVYFRDPFLRAELVSRLALD